MSIVGSLVYEPNVTMSIRACSKVRGCLLLNQVDLVLMCIINRFCDQILHYSRLVGFYMIRDILVRGQHLSRRLEVN